MMQVFQVLKLLSPLKITKNSTWYLLNLAIKNVFYGNQINDNKTSNVNSVR